MLVRLLFAPVLPLRWIPIGSMGVANAGVRFAFPVKLFAHFVNFLPMCNMQACLPFPGHCVTRMVAPGFCVLG